MNLQIIAHEFPITPSLRERLERRLTFAFNHARTKMLRIIVRLRDVNGPRGGADKVCQVSVSMPGCREIVVQDKQKDMYHAIDSAVKRAARCAMRIVANQRAVPRRELNTTQEKSNRAFDDE